MRCSHALLRATTGLLRIMLRALPQGAIPTSRSGEGPQMGMWQRWRGWGSSCESGLRFQRRRMKSRPPKLPSRTRSWPRPHAQASRRCATRAWGEGGEGGKGGGGWSCVGTVVTAKMQRRHTGTSRASFEPAHARKPVTPYPRCSLLNPQPSALILIPGTSRPRVRTPGLGPWIMCP
jgi:hypothetical protein